MLFRYTARKSGKVPIYISRERNICLLDVGQVYHGIVYALSGGEKGNCHAWYAGGRVYGKRVWNSKTGECGGCFVQALLLDDAKIECGRLYTDLCSIFIL